MLAFTAQSVSNPLKPAFSSLIRGTKAIGHFLYGDDIRTRRSLAFAYASILFYLLLAINIDRVQGACGG